MGIGGTELNGTAFLKHDIPTAERVTMDGPDTYVMWGDGSWTKAHCDAGDEYDPLLGIMLCAARKLGHRVDDFADAFAIYADGIQSVSDLDELIEFERTLFEVLTALRLSTGTWLPQLGPDTECPVSGRVDELEDRVDDIVRSREAMRQKLRDLIDAGEL